MGAISDELFEIAEHLDSTRTKFDLPEIKNPLESLEDAATKVGKSWSGSWLGHHSRIYYKDLQLPPPGAHFSQEWGLWRVAFHGTTGDWSEFNYDDVRNAICKIAGNPNLKPAEDLYEKVSSILEDKRAELISLLTTELEGRDDSFIDGLKKKAEEIKAFHSSDYIRHLRPSGQFVSRDRVAIDQGLKTPPHFAVLAEIMAIRNLAEVCEHLANVAKRAASHLAKRERYARRKQEIGTNVFIGHGQSPLWKDLKDFIKDRLGLPWDEFNRVPVAGITNIARLSQMLDDAAIAFLVMTAEDEQTDGRMHARMNVIHEAGLFQGRLAFTKAIVLLEEGCEEFSNIQGLGQIRFPKGNIKAAFEEIRQVLEREGLLVS